MVTINTPATGVERGWATWNPRAGALQVPNDAVHMLHSPRLPSGAQFLGFARREVWPLFVALMGEIERVRRSKIRGTTKDGEAQCWAGEVRPIRGMEAAAHAGNLSAWSNHSYGVAFDVESGENPLGAEGRGTMPANAGQLAHKYGFRWGASRAAGGDYTGRPDRMHFEFQGTPADAVELARTLNITATEDDDMAAYTDAERAEILKAARQVNSTAGPGQRDLQGTLEATLGTIQGLVNLTRSGQGALSSSITDTRSAVLAAVAAAPTAHLDDDERTQLAEEIASKVPDVTLEQIEEALRVVFADAGETAA